MKKTLWFGPQLKARPFKIFFSTAYGFGTIELGRQLLHIDLLEGALPLEKVVLTEAGQTRILDWKTTVRPDAPSSKQI